MSIYPSAMFFSSYGFYCIGIFQMVTDWTVEKSKWYNFIQSENKSCDI